MNTKRTDLGKKTYQFDIIVPKPEIEAAYKKGFDKMAADLSVEGFRKGKVPKKIAEKHLKKDDVYKSVVNELIPAIYKDLLEKEKLRPIVAPKIELIKAKEGEDWEIRITLSEKPDVDLKNYKEVVGDILKGEKKDDIWVPGKGKDEEKPDADVEAKKRMVLNKVLENLLKNISVEVSDLILEDELNKKLSQLVDDVRRVGLSMENYLKSKSETMDSLKEKYRREIEDMYKIEFILEEIADREKIVVSQEDLDRLFASIEDEKQREEAKKNAYFYASILKRQKTLDNLLGL